MSSQPGEATTFAELVVIHASDHGAATGSADARGGVDVAKAGAAALGPKLKELSKSLPPSEYLAQVFPMMDAAIKEKDGARFEAMGSTAVCVVVTAEEIACGWLGDSKALLGTAQSVEALSTEHKPTDAGEKARIAAADG